MLDARASSEFLSQVAIQDRAPLESRLVSTLNTRVSPTSTVYGFPNGRRALHLVRPYGAPVLQICRGMRFMLQILCAGISATAFAGEVVSLNEFRIAPQLAQFIGTYIQGNVDDPDDAILVINDGELIQWYTCGNMACTSFQMDIRNFGQTIETPFRKGGVSRTTSGWNGEALYVEKVSTSGRQREIERKELKIEGRLLTLWTKRHYERRSLWKGEWEVTNKPAGPDSALSIMDHRMYMVKIADTAITAEAFREQASKRPAKYLVLTAAMNDGKTVRQQIGEGHFIRVTEEQLSALRNPPVATILPLRPDCEEEL